MIAGPSLSFLIHMKYVVFICSRITIMNSNWPRMRKFRQLLQAGKTVAFDFSPRPRPRVGRALRPIFMLWLVKNWQVSSNLFTLTAEADIVLCHLVMFLTDFRIFFLTVSLNAHACFDRPEYKWVQFVFQNWELLHSVRGLYDKKSAS